MSSDNRSPGPLFRLDKNWFASIANIHDGSSNTIAVADATIAVPWTKPADLSFTPNGPLPPLGVNNGNFNILMVDGSVHRMNQGFDQAAMRSAIMIDDGNALPPDFFGR